MRATTSRIVIAVTAGAVALATASGCSHFSVGTPYRARALDQPSDGLDGRAARIVVRDGVTLAEVGGTPEEIGRQTGTLFGEQIRAQVARCLAAFGDGPETRRRARALADRIPDDHRRELRAVADAAGVPWDDLLTANLVVETRCSVVAAWGEARGGAPLAVARNLDFHPADVVGPFTVVLLVRPAGKRPFVSVGWPGFAAVTSGINDAGVATMILLNLESHRRSDAEPLGFRMRRMLETCASAAEAKALLADAPVATGDFCTIADADEVVAAWQQRDGSVATLAPDAGTVTCTNGPTDAAAAVQRDARSRCLSDLLASEPRPLTNRTLRALLEAVALDFLNCQAMVFEPESRRLDLALGTTFVPAAGNDWHAIELAPWFAGAGPDAIAVRRLERPEGRFEHYKVAVPPRPAGGRIPLDRAPPTR